MRLRRLSAEIRKCRSIRRRACSRRCAYSSMTNWVNWCAHLHAAERVLKPGGRLVVVTFHSLEDRIVKRFFSDRSGTGGGSRHLPQLEQRLASFIPVGKGIVAPSEAEARTQSPSAFGQVARRNRVQTIRHSPRIIRSMACPIFPHSMKRRGADPCCVPSTSF